MSVVFTLQSENRYVFARDSLATLLEKRTFQKERLEILTHLSDIDFLTGDSAYILTCWNAAVEQKNFFVMDAIAAPMYLKYLSRKNRDSACVWYNRAMKNFEGDWLKSNKEFMLMMSDIRKHDKYEELAEKLRSDQVKLKVQISPYRSMRILYSLAVLSDMAKAANPKSILRPAQEYLEQAYEIADQLPDSLSFYFKKQILLELSSINRDYAQKNLSFLYTFYAQPKIQKRPYFSKYSLMMAYDRLIADGNGLSTDKLNIYYDSLAVMLDNYSKSLPLDPVYYKTRLKFNYFKSTNQIDSSLVYCDSLINSKFKYRKNKAYLHEYKCKTLGEIGNWEEGYNAAIVLLGIRDSLANVSSKNQLEELQTQYELDVALNKAMHKKNQLILFAVSVCVLIVLLFIILLRSLKLRYKNRVLLNQLNEYASVITSKEKDQRSALQKDRLGQIASQTACVNSENQDHDEELKSEELLALFEKLDNFIRNEKKYADSALNREMLTLQLGVNKNKLSEAVYLVTGKTISDYIVDIRLDESLLLIKVSPKISLTEVADKCGFGTYSTFYRAFLKRYGVKPAEYKKYLSEK
ncbi:MAG: helix-turn-helix domain-containing protein [Bacteroidales bacterium]